VYRFPCYKNPNDKVTGRKTKKQIQTRGGGAAGQGQTAIYQSSKDPLIYHKEAKPERQFVEISYVARVRIHTPFNTNVFV
jgi:hypothetical protein